MRIKLVLFSFFLIFFACKNDQKNSGKNQTTDDSNKIDDFKSKSSKNIEFPIISENSFMNFKVGDPIVDDGYKVRESTLETGEGVYIIYELFDNRYGKLGYLMPNSENGKKIRSITILNKLVKTIQGIYVGATFSELLAQFPKIKVHGSEIESRTHASEGNLSYRLAFNSSEVNLDRSLIPPDTKITEIIIH